MRSEHDGIPLGIFCRQSLARYLDPDEIFEVTRQGFDFYHQAFGIKYPFGKYDQLFVPEFKEGAMENAGAVTFLEDYVFRSRVTDYAREARGETILHEMAHMWFGDLVTMRWWDDLWLNESFATWAGTEAQARATRWPNSWTTFTTAWKAWACKQDQLPSTHPIAADIPDIHAVEVNFDGITYAKGAAVLKQLVAYVGQDNFLAGVRAYFAAHSYGNATLADLLAALEETSGRDLGAWSREWLETAGVNTLRPSYSVDDEGRFTAFSVLQSAAPSHPTLRSHRIAIGLYSLTADGAWSAPSSVETDVTGDWTPVPALVGVTAARPGADQRRRPHLRQDPARPALAADRRLVHRLVHRVAARRPGLGRGLGHGARRGDGGPRLRAPRPRRGGLGPRHQRGADAAAAGDPGGAAVRRPGLERRGPGLHRLVAAVAAADGAARLGPPARLPARASPRWRPRRTTWTSWPGCSTATVRLDGLAVDTDLRWALLRRLVSRGVRGEEAIDAELSRDATDAGERHAAACRAAIPTLSAKRETWETLTDGKLTIAMFRATIIGFADPDQPALIQPYRPEYFAALAPVWQDWSSAMAQDFVEYGYTIGAADAATIAATDAYLASSPEPPAALRRLLAEGRDEVVRALRNQAVDRAAAEAGLSQRTRKSGHRPGCPDSGVTAQPGVAGSSAPVRLSGWWFPPAPGPPPRGRAWRSRPAARSPSRRWRGWSARRCPRPGRACRW